jgi:glucose/arabinose dehydrogenase
VSRVRAQTAWRGRVAVSALSGLLGVAVLTGCGTDGYEPAGPFRPLPQGAPPDVGPPTTPQAPPPEIPAQPGGEEEAGDPNVMASGLDVPTGLVVLPDGSAVVGERETGRLLQVFPDRSPPRELMTVPGVDTAGDGGLLGLALSPTFTEDGLLYAYLSTGADNRVVRFPLGGTPNPVLTGIPRGEQNNGGALHFGSDRLLYVGTGDTGRPELAADPTSLAGKVLRIDVFGRPAEGEDDRIFSSGHRDVTAICGGGADAPLYVTGDQELNAIVEDSEHGWPDETPQSTDPVVDFPPDRAGLGGCAVAGTTVFVGSMPGERINVVNTDGSGDVVGEVEDLLAGEYGRLRTVVLDTEGGLWVTTSNRDGAGTPADDDDKVLRILPPDAASDSPL